MQHINPLNTEQALAISQCPPNSQPNGQLMIPNDSHRLQQGSLAISIGSISTITVQSAIVGTNSWEGSMANNLDAMLEQLEAKLDESFRDGDGREGCLGIQSPVRRKVEGGNEIQGGERHSGVPNQDNYAITDDNAASRRSNKKQLILALEDGDDGLVEENGYHPSEDLGSKQARPSKIQSHPIDQEGLSKSIDSLAGSSRSRGGRANDNKSYTHNNPSMTIHDTTTTNNDLTIGSRDSSPEAGDYYRDLSMKLERALLKISSSKKFMGMGGVSKSQHYVQSGKKPNRTMQAGSALSGPSQLSNASYLNATLSRFEHHQHSREVQISRQRKELEEYQMAEMTGRPTINEKSRLMAKGSEPIHQRAERLLATKKKNIDAKKRQLEQLQRQKQMEEERQLQQHQAQVKERHPNPRSCQQFYTEQQSWLKTREGHAKSRASTLAQSFAAQHPFKPQLNPESVRMMMKQDGRLKVFERDVQPKKVWEDANCTFRPNLKPRK